MASSDDFPSGKNCHFFIHKWLFFFGKTSNFALHFIIACSCILLAVSAYKKVALITLAQFLMAFLHRRRRTNEQNVPKFAK